jgi:hypothetical protein
MQYNPHGGRRNCMRRKHVKLTVKDRAKLERFCSTGVHDVRLVDRAKIILALDISGAEAPNGRKQ